MQGDSDTCRSVETTVELTTVHGRKVEGKLGHRFRSRRRNWNFRLQRPVGGRRFYPAEHGLIQLLSPLPRGKPMAASIKVVDGSGQQTTDLTVTHTYDFTVTVRYTSSNGPAQVQCVCVYGNKTETLD